MSTVSPSATVTIANGDTESNAIDLGELAIVGMQTPASMTGTAITFKASADNSTFVVVKKIDGSTYSMVTASSQYYVIPPADLAGIRYLKVVSGSAETGAKIISLMVRAV